MDYEKNEKKFIVAYETTLADEGREICKEVDSTSFVNNELLVEKAVVYCQFISRQEDVDPKLVEKCKNYVEITLIITKLLFVILTMIEGKKKSVLIRGI